MSTRKIVPLLIVCIFLTAALPAATVATLTPPNPLDKVEGPVLEEIEAAGWPLLTAAPDVPPAAPPYNPSGRPGSTIVVNTTADELNSDGDCALREAIQSANTDTAVDACPAGSGADTVIVPAGTYTLTIPGAYEDGNLTGDLDILDDVTIQGAGAESTIVDGNSLDRVLHVHLGRTVQIDDLTVAHGYVEGYQNGGGVANYGGTLTLNNVVLRHNTSGTNGVGGGLDNRAQSHDAITTLNSCLIISNTAQYAAGGISTVAGTGQMAILAVNDSTIRGNSALGVAIFHSSMGGAANAASVMTLTNSLVENNDATYVCCGSIQSVGSPNDNVRGKLWIEGSTIAGNAGGGLAILGSNVTIVNSTVSGNWNDQAGGGIHLTGWAGPATLVLTNTTVADNTTSQAGGGIMLDNTGDGMPTAIFKNSLIGGNTTTSGLGQSCDYRGVVEFTSLGNNLEDHDDCHFDQPSDLPNTDPLLGPLADNGGGTFTHALLEGSLARDAGDDAACPPTDQRGVSRPQGPHCDIGSFEAFPDTNPPDVVAVSPPDGATAVALDAPVLITFSEPISVNTFAYAVSPDPGGWVQAWGPNDIAVTLTHTPFAYGTLYTATIAAADDRAGNPLAEPVGWSFTTQPCPPVSAADFVWTPRVPSAGDPITFTATASSTRPLTYTWDVGDGTVATGVTVTHAYTPAADYLVTMTATNDCGSWQAVSDTVTVAPRPCQGVSIVTITAAVSGCVATLQAELTGDSPFTFLWELGPLGTYTATSPQVDFGDTGTFSGTLSVWNCGNTEPATRSFTVEVNCRGPYFAYLPLVVRGLP